MSTSAMKMFSQMLTQFFGSETVNDSPSRRRILPGVVIVVALAGLSITIVISADQSPRFYEAVDADIAFSQQVQRIRMVTLAKKLSTLLKNLGR